MRISKFLSISVTAAMVAAGTLLVASPASAETTVDGVTFYGSSDFGVESSGYPTGVDWFFGDVSGTEGAHSFTNTGLTLNDPASGDVQILNQNVTTPASAGDLTRLVDGTDVYAQNADWVFQLAFFGEGASSDEFTTLRPVTQGDPETAGMWITSQAIGLAYAAGDTATFSDLANALYADEPPTLLAYGIFVDSTWTTTINAVVWGEDASSFGAIPTRTMTPNPITAQAFSTAGQGLTLSGTNWFPGSEIYVNISGADGTVYHDESLTVGPDGTATVNIVLSTEPQPGTYYVEFDDNGFYYGYGLLDHYVASPFGEGDEESAAEGLLLTVTAPALAETGVDTSTLAIGGSLVLLLGGLVLAAARLTRRRAA